MLSEPTAAHRQRAQHALYPIHRTVGIEYEELTPDGQRTVDKVARLLAEVEAPIRELHRPFGIYDECGHEHTIKELDAGLCLNVNEVGLTCDDALMYRICRSCCTGDGYQTEECVTNHEHGEDVPICATIAVLEKHDAPVHV